MVKATQSNTDTKEISIPENSVFTATLAGGCFWCLEAMFRRLKGVSDVRSGFSGGDSDNPTYESVCQGNTNHAEVVHFNYDPDVIDFVTIAKVFFTVHNPTTLNRQGNDVGTQYRSAIFYHDEHQHFVAKALRQYLEDNDIWQNIVTEITPFTAFYPADSKHENFWQNNPDNSYCQLVIAPKVAKFSELFAEYLQDDTP